MRRRKTDPFVRNFFVRTEPLAESNLVPQDPISAIHPPCIYARDVTSAMGFGLCRSKMMNGIVALHSPPMRKDAAEKNGTLLRSAGCVGSRITSALLRERVRARYQLPPPLGVGGLVPTPNHRHRHHGNREMASQRWHHHQYHHHKFNYLVQVISAIFVALLILFYLLSFFALSPLDRDYLRHRI
ncbi:hypothetical protein QYF36_019563 [Acer negundo]|nr:hypothetical protein QYF36_019563 [Acer negundo]